MGITIIPILFSLFYVLFPILQMSKLRCRLRLSFRVFPSCQAQRHSAFQEFSLPTPASCLPGTDVILPHRGCARVPSKEASHHIVGYSPISPIPLSTLDFGQGRSSNCGPESSGGTYRSQVLASMLSPSLGVGSSSGPPLGGASSCLTPSGHPGARISPDL